MVTEFAEYWPAIEESLTDKFSKKAPGSYDEILESMIVTLHSAMEDNWRDCPDPERITRIDHGDYQGTTVWVIAETGYQPSTYYVTKNYYGSCSGCDTLQA